MSYDPPTIHGTVYDIEALLQKILAAVEELVELAKGERP